VFYRRKILLSLIEVFGGFLSKTDCQKLLFLFCQRRGKNYYDFFPHKYGNFSLVLSQDRSRLADLGFLTSHSDFQLKDNHCYIEQIKEEDRSALKVLVSEIGDLRGEELVRKVYLEFPHYVSRSQIASKILDCSEYEQVSQAWNTAQSSCLFTIGYEGLTIDAYLNILVSNNVLVLVDVRKNPLSMKYGFSKKRLSDYARTAGIAYIHIPDLGIPSNLRQQLDNEAAYQNLFEYYSSQILPAHIDAIEKLKAVMRDQGRVAITCFEADYQFCHRHKVTEYLGNDPGFNTPIIHLSRNSFGSLNFSDKPSSYGLWDENGVYSSM
jgi:uncharacterized protein (DUF488 family)